MGDGFDPRGLGAACRTARTRRTAVRAALLSFSLVLGWAQTTRAAEDTRFYDFIVDEVHKELSESSQRAIDAAPSTACDPLGLGSKPTLRISIFLGVMETTVGTSWDRPAKHALIEFLKQPCRPDYFACGFVESTNPESLVKVIGAHQKAMLTVHDSSVSEFAKRSTTSLRVEQEQKSKTTTAEFLKALERDHVVFFVGHSRYGTGPGFSWFEFPSPRWLTSFVSSPLRHQIETTLQSTESPPALLGMFGCSSERYYARDFRAVAPDTVLILSKGITHHITNVGEAANVLSSLLGGACYANAAGTMSPLLPDSPYRLYGPPPGQSRHLRAYPSLFALTLFILLVPLVLIVAGKAPSPAGLRTPNPRAWVEDLAALVVSAALALVGAKVAASLHARLAESALPLFIGTLGGLLLVWRLLRGHTGISELSETVKAHRIPIAIVVALYFVFSVAPALELRQVLVAATQTFWLCATGLLAFPFAALSFAIIAFPLYGPRHFHLGTRIIVFVGFAVLISYGLSFGVAHTSFWLVPHQKEIFVLLCVLEIISLGLYLLRSCLDLPILFQTLTLALLFAEGVHQLFV